MALIADFLASDIVFPSDSNEPKLSVNHHASKLPDPVDWAFHDYYSTALEKSYTPVHSLTADLHMHDAYAPPSPAKQAVNNDAQHLRAVLRGALQVVANDMERNHHGTAITPPKNDPACWKWEDELMYDHWTLPQDDDHFDLDSGYGRDADSVALSDTQDEHCRRVEPHEQRNNEEEEEQQDDEEDDDTATSASTVAAASSSHSSTSTKWSGVVDKFKALVKPSLASSSSSASSVHHHEKRRDRRLPWKRLLRNRG